MRTRSIVHVVASLALCLSMADANPILEGYFNEFMFTTNGWVLEMHVHTTTLDGWYMRSNAGTAYFRSGIQLDFGRYVLITPDSLLSPLVISASGDSVTIHSPQGIMAGLTFGSSSSRMIAGPRMGQSICLHETRSYCYLDNTPTLGQPNHALNATGIIQGFVRDSLGQQIAGVQVSSYEWPGFVVTDTSGRFTTSDYARRVLMSLTHPDCTPTSTSLQVWPESTTTVNIVMNRLTGVVGEPTTPVTSALSQNYPNPFNPSTRMIYRIAEAGLVSLRVFDMAGREVATLVNGMIQRGSYEVNWDASSLPSGMYLCRLQSGGLSQTRKLLLIR